MTKELRVILLTCICLGAIGVLAAQGLGSGDAAPKPAARHATLTQYVSLGDSLAAGLQPDAKGNDRPTGDGYVFVVGRRLSKPHPGLATQALSCGGATTTTLLHGNAACQDEHEPSQVEQAEDVLGRRGRRTVRVTVNIGDNDVEQCLKMGTGSIDGACVKRGTAAVEKNLPVIARRLRQAAGPGVPIVGILDYDQFLALWLKGAHGRAVARRSVAVITALNAQMARIYRDAGVLVADAGERFGTTDLTTPVKLPGHGTVPLAVSRVCRWTWACAAPPVGPDDHARAAGYRVIADAVLAALPR